MDGQVTHTAGTLGPDGDDVPAVGERVDELARADGFRVEHITSGVVDTPVEFLQAHDEWVLVLDGSARLEVGATEHVLGSGDWVLIRASKVHRLLHVAPGTRWLAVHDRPEGRVG